ncbi:MAG TPA: 2-oxoacid:acceptor oxidoreductase family protein [Gemmatimonadales bacterium]|nr:2-oxoacid:acceptor oxidoreductase family protein [Gemmatimonadales bacterium]
MIARDPFQVRLSGSGGQGVILASVLLAEAGMHDGLQVVQTQSYGPAARLGAAKSEVVLSHHQIAFPEVSLPDAVVCLSQDAYRKYGGQVAEGGLRIVESDVAAGLPAAPAGTILLPITSTARDLGPDGVITANVVALGALVALSAVVSVEGARRALRERVKPETLELNQRAFEAGLRLGAGTAAIASAPP